jgi:hypothetical protein
MYFLVTICFSGVRPFGVSLLIAGYDDNGPQLYQVCMRSYMIGPLIISFTFAILLFLYHHFVLIKCWVPFFCSSIQVDPSGSYFSWKASAMGKNVSNAKTFLEKRYIEEWSSLPMMLHYTRCDSTNQYRWHSDFLLIINKFHFLMIYVSVQYISSIYGAWWTYI